jgi:hypothetical protein
MVQKVTIITDASVALKPLVESAIRSELHMLQLGLERTRERLRFFEQKYGMSSEEFEQKWNRGEIEESLEVIEWAGEMKTGNLLEAQRQALLGAQLN